MNEKFFPEILFDKGYTDLISVVPPGAQMSPMSKITASSAGKVPGRRNANGLWAGYDWRKFVATAESVKQWCIDGASTGLRANRFPALDIDTTNEAIAQIVEEAALAKLGAAPIRVGRYPKRVLMYRTDTPFSRMRLQIKHRDDTHLIEMLGEGQQFLVHGIHPVTNRPYEWLQAVPRADELTAVTREQVDAFFEYLKALLEMLNHGEVRRVGDGRVNERTTGDQKSLAAPSLEILREAVSKIPNNDDLFPGRDEYVKMGYAIRAAASEDLDEGYQVFAEWAGRHEKDGRVAGNPETWLADWRRFDPPFAVGWSWIAEQARAFGFSDAQDEFDTIAAPPDETTVNAPMYSDQWLADRVAAARCGEIRFVPKRDYWVVWTGGRWKPDADLLAEDVVKQELRIIANEVMNHGATDAEKKAAEARAISYCSAGKATAVRGLMQSDRGIAVALESLDFDIWKINTPNGIVDLKTGELLPPDPDALFTKSTAVPVDFDGRCDRWLQFLRETTGDDETMIGYLQRLAGYALTGSTREQSLQFIYGEGGNGKGVFVNCLNGILKDYAQPASMDTFTASYSDKHSTDIAQLVGARLVTASETQAGKRWDEAKVKLLTGGDPVTARFMRQDNFTYTPQFKLIFLGNHKPELRDVDAAMRRRIQIVPFNRKPEVPDGDLSEKLRAEWPAILAWMIDGCLKWQENGLQPPPKVLASTEEYFREEDAVGRWIEECLDADAESVEPTTDLFNSWREWCNANNEYAGSLKRLSAALTAKGFEKTRDNSDTRRRGFKGYRIIDRQQFGVA